MKLAAIDAGSNTLRLLIGQNINGKIVPELYMRRICRLAGGYSPDQGLSPAARQRTLRVFHEFAKTCRQFEIQQVRAVGTAAFRQASNGEGFANQIRTETLIPLEIISGSREADYMAAGVLSALDPMPAHALIIDIGGGSTEFVLCTQQKVVWSISLALGVVRLTEEYSNQKQRHDAMAAVLAELFTDLIKACHAFDIDVASLTLVGTAGTVTTLAALDLHMTEYDWRRINNHTMNLSCLQRWQSILGPLSAVEREALQGMEVGRGDLIIAGLDIILALMREMPADSLTVSDFGLLEGLLLSL